MREETIEQKMCEHKYQQIETGHETPSLGVSAQMTLRKFVVLFCEKCGTTLKSFY